MMGVLWGDLGDKRSGYQGIKTVLTCGSSGCPPPLVGDMGDFCAHAHSPRYITCGIRQGIAGMQPQRQQGGA